MIKTIINESDGTDIEAKILRKIQQHIFMLYPMSGVRASLISVANDKEYKEGIYIYLIGYGANFFMRIPEEYLVRTIAYDTYNPFFEDEVNKKLKKYIKRDEELKKVRLKAAHLRNMPGKIIFEVSRKPGKKHLLKCILEGLGL